MLHKQLSESVMKTFYRTRLLRIQHLFYRNLTCALFFILPKKLTNVFYSLSLVSLICKLRQTTLEEISEKNLDKFTHLLHVAYDKEVLLLPEFATNWLWDPVMLNSKIIIKGKEMTVREVISDEHTFNSHFRQVLDYIIKSSPGLIKFKLNLSDKIERLRFKHNVMGLLLVH